jgi:hypothetical protein
VLDCKYKETIKGFSFFTVLPPKRMRWLGRCSSGGLLNMLNGNEH